MMLSNELNVEGLMYLKFISLKNNIILFRQEFEKKILLH